MWNIIIFLIVVGVLLLVTETFVPGGILGTIGLILVVAGIVITYREHGPAVGHMVLGVSVLGSAVIIYLGLKIFPKTGLGKKIILQSNVAKENGYDSSVKYLEGIVGMRGVVISDLRPAGIALIDDKRIDVISEGGYIDDGENIKVVRVDGNKVLVIKDDSKNTLGGSDNG